MPRLTPFVLSLCLISPGVRADSHPRWHLAADRGLAWDVAPGDTHADFIEMNGEQVGLVLKYGVDGDGSFSVNPDVIWPRLRLHPNLTGSELRVAFGEDGGRDQDDRFSRAFLPSIAIEGGETGLPLVSRTLQRVRIRDLVAFDGTFRFEGGRTLSFERKVFPSVHQPVVIDTTMISNRSRDRVTLYVDDFRQTRTISADRGTDGAYTILAQVLGAGSYSLGPGDSTRVSIIYEAHKDGESEAGIDVPRELDARHARSSEITSKMVLVTPEPVLNTAFEFAKRHTTESIFETKVGLLHSPGGGRRYYAAIWANDEAEYANPFFGMLGDKMATEAAINSFRLFARYMNPDFRAIPSSIISEGAGSWDGAGDRGDMAMIAYGAARFALANGDRQTAHELWPLISWCLEFLHRKTTAQGVVVSDSDELEGRFPAGRANLNTSALYYDALRSAADLGRDLNEAPSLLTSYEKSASCVLLAIEHYFGADVEGFHTYRYYDRADLATSSSREVRELAHRPDILRSWIATPLAMGIFDRKEGTIQALFSPHLWTSEGALTEEGQDTVWDRSTLYALRGALAAGATEPAMRALRTYTNRRLLGDHIPYPIETSPEGAQLSAESALYCRIFTEGLFAIRPTGLNTFEITPRMPQAWASMTLKNVHAFGSSFELKVERLSIERLDLVVLEKGRVPQLYHLNQGETVAVSLRGSSHRPQR